MAEGGEEDPDGNTLLRLPSVPFDCFLLHPSQLFFLKLKHINYVFDQIF